MTTEERRNRSYNIMKDIETVNNASQYSNNIKKSLADKIKADQTNREFFSVINSELTGLAYEYRYMTGYYHATLDETEYSYTDYNDDKTDFITKYYYDTEKLRNGAALLLNNEFHLNTTQPVSEVPQTYYPIHPIKYSHWVGNTSSEVFTFYQTEAELFDVIDDMIAYYTSGNSGYSYDISGEYKEQILGIAEDDDNQPYMTIGFGESIYSDPGFDFTDDLILINGTDSDNFAYGKIIACKTEPSRILFTPYCIRGTIPDNAEITTTYTISASICTEIMIETIYTLETIYQTMQYYLNNNPNTDTSNSDMLTNLTNVLALIETWKDNPSYADHTVMQTLIGNIETERNLEISDRITYIETYLPTATDLYIKRFDIIDMRLEKRIGTLREVMKFEKGVSDVFELTDQKNNNNQWYYQNFLIVRKCEKDGDIKRRILIRDPDDDFEIGDFCYLLSDNVDVPEISGTIESIVDARMPDLINSTYNTETQEMIQAYYDVKKIFLTNMTKNGVTKTKYNFTEIYKVSENFRIIKEVP